MGLRTSTSRAWAYPVVLVLGSCARPSASPQPDPPPVAEAADSSAPDPIEMPPSEQPPPPAESASIQYLIEGKSVDKATFEALVASTTEVPGTWYCDEMIDGGETGWDGKDAEGTVYEIRLLSVEAGSTHSIRGKRGNP